MKKTILLLYISLIFSCTEKHKTDIQRYAVLQSESQLKIIKNLKSIVKKERENFEAKPTQKTTLK